MHGAIHAFLTPCENPKFGSDGTTRWKAGWFSSPLVNSGINLVASKKLPGPIPYQPYLISFSLWSMEQDGYTQPWTKSKGIALGAWLRWCMKWISSSPNPETGTGTVNCASSSFNCRSFSRQSKSFFHNVISRFISSKGTPRSHSALSSSSGKVVRLSFWWRTWSFESGTLMVKGLMDILYDFMWIGSSSVLLYLAHNIYLSHRETPHTAVLVPSVQYHHDLPAELHTPGGYLGLCVYIAVRIQNVIHSLQMLF